jgi:hypothetical protein
MVRVGLSRGLQDMVEGTPDAAGDVVRKIFGTKAKRAAIRSVFNSDSEFRKFESELAKIAKETESFRYVRTGSKTSRALTEGRDADVVGEVAGTLNQVTQGWNYRRDAFGGWQDAQRVRKHG